MSCRAPIGYLSINAVPTAVNQGFITLKRNEFFSPLYILFWIRANMDGILSRAGGATFAEISRKAFKEIPFIKPPQGILSAYSKLADPILFELESITRENHTLLTLRDALLPRLVSGELQIPEEMLAS
jgi:type I restriction enzyme S subunit